MDWRILAIIVAALCVGALAKNLLDRLFVNTEDERRRREERKKRKEERRAAGRAATMESIGNRVLSVLPIDMQRQSAMERALHRAGIKLSVGSYWALWIATGLLGLIVAIVLTSKIPSVSALQRLAIGAIVVAAFVAAPPLIVRSRAHRRAEQIEAALPAVLELLSVVVSAGQTIERAIKTVGEKSDTPLAEEFAQVDTAITTFGQTPAVALGRMAERVAVQPVSLFVASVIQALESGAEIGETLKMQAQMASDNYYLKIEEKSNKIRTKMIFPTVLLILPPVFIITLTPVIMQYLAVMPA